MLVNNLTSATSKIISFGKITTAPCLIPVIHNSSPMCINEDFMVNGECYKITALALLSPFAIVFVDDVNAFDVKGIGHSLSIHARFPAGANVVFAEISGKNSMKTRLWQFKEGELPFTTEAVCAAAVAAMMLQKVLPGEVNVQMGDNNFLVEQNRDDGEIFIKKTLSLL